MNGGSEKKHVCDDGKEKKKKISRKNKENKSGHTQSMPWNESV